MSRRAKHTGSRRLALDANLLILWVTGLHNRGDVGRTKRNGACHPEQFDQLDSLLLPYIFDSGVRSRLEQAFALESQPPETRRVKQF